MHLRRALLLFAIVLAMTALAASLSRPAEQGDEASTPPPAPAAEERPSAGAAPGSGPAESVSLEAAEDRSARITAGRPATLEVAVDEPGTVAIPDLGLSSPGDRLTPARFELLIAERGRHEIVFTPASDDIEQPAGRVIVRSEG